MEEERARLSCFYGFHPLTQQTNTCAFRIITGGWQNVHWGFPSLLVSRSIQYSSGEMFYWHPDADSDPTPVMNCNSKAFAPVVHLVPKRDVRRLGTSQRTQLHFHYFIAWICTRVTHIRYDQARPRQRTDRTNASFKLLSCQHSFA